MDIEDDVIPASPQGKPSYKRHRNKDQPVIRSKRVKLKAPRPLSVTSLAAASEHSLQIELIEISDNDDQEHDAQEQKIDTAVKPQQQNNAIAGPSTSAIAARPSKKIDIYSLIPNTVNHLTANELLSNSIDIHINAKLLEEADNASYVRKSSLNSASTLPRQNGKFVSFSQLFGRPNKTAVLNRSVLTKYEGEDSPNENETNTNRSTIYFNRRPIPSVCPATVSIQKSLQFETQYFEETDSQISKAFIVADAAQCLNEVEFSQWTSPQREIPSPISIVQNSPNIVDRILDDFDFESPPNEMSGIPSTSRTEHAIPSSPVLAVRRDSQRTYSRLKPKIRLKSSKKLRFDHLESDTSSGSENEEKTSSSLNETIFEIGNNIDLDLNSSRNIIENMESLTTFFTQQDFDEPLANLVGVDDCDLSVVNVDPNDSLTPVEVGLFGVIQHTEDSRLFCDLSDVEDIYTPEAIHTDRVRGPCEKSLLDMDEDYLMDVSPTQIVSNYRKITETATKNRPSTSRPIRSEPNSATIIKMVQPTSVIPTVGFSTARGKSINVSHKYLKDTAQLFADIDKVLPITEDTPSASVEIPLPSTNLRPQVLGAIDDNPQFGGFQTGRGKTIKISDEALQRSTAIYDDVRQQVLIANQSERATLDSNAAKWDNKENVASNKIPCGFTNGRGNSIATSSNAMKRTTAIFDDIENELSTASADNNKSGISTARANIIYPPNKRFKNAAQLFGDILNEMPIDECDGLSTSRDQFLPSISFGFKSATLNQIQGKDDGTSTNPVIQATILGSINDNAAVCGFKTGRGSIIKISEEALQRSTATYNEVRQEVAASNQLDATKLDSNAAIRDKNNMAPKMSVNGFTTSRGDAIKISSAAMKRTTGLFDDIEGELSTAMETNLIAVSKQNESHNMCNLGAEASDQRVIRMGFTTPAGNKINRSTKAAAAAATTVNLFDASDVDDEFQIVDMLGTRIESPTPDFFGFSSGRGTSLQASTDALNKIERIFNNRDDLIIAESKLLRRPNADAHQDAFKTPINAKFRPGLITSTPNTSLTTPGTSEITPKTLQRLKSTGNLKSAEDSLSYLHQHVEMIFNDDENDDERRLPKQTCLATKFDMALENETITETSIADQSLSPEIQTCPAIIPENVKLGRRLALQQQANLTNRTSERIKPEPGSLLLEKMILSSKQKLIDFGLPTHANAAELKSLGILESTLNFTPTNFDKFEFKMWEHYSLDICQTNINGIKLKDDICLVMTENATVGLTEIKCAFLQCPSVDPKLIPDLWIENSVKWILWKLASLELRFPQQFSANALTPENVLLQLKYRYDREIDRAERSVIQRIVERDDVAARRMILFVSNIKKITNIDEYSMELCDGWYSIGVQFDVVLQHAIKSGKIEIGTKLIVQGAELIGAEDACTPLENNNSVQLKIAANSTRRAQWHTKLGYYKNIWPFILSLNAIHDKGGLVSRLAVYILRVYPIMYMIKCDDGGFKKTIFRSEKVGRRFSRIEERERLELVEKLYSEVRSEVEIEFEQRQKSMQPPAGILSEIDDAEELWNLMERSHDPAAFEMKLSSTQKQMVSAYCTKLYDDRLNEINERVRDKLNAHYEEESKVSYVLKIRVIDARRPGNKTANISIWNPSENYATVLREGHFLEVHNIFASGLRWSELLLSTGKRTTYRNITCPLLSQHIDMGRKFTSIASIDPMAFLPILNEFDTVGFVVSIDEQAHNRFQPVYITDAKKNLLCVNFWIGIKEYAYEDIVQSGNFIAISQLEWRSANQLKHSNIPQAYATDYTVFTNNPKNPNLMANFKALQNDFKAFSDNNGFIDECRDAIESAKLNNVTLRSNTSTTTPLRSASFNCVDTPSPLTVNGSSSSISKSELSPAISIVQQKLDILGNYVQPPPIAPITLKATGKRRSFRNAFKSPMRIDFYKDLESKK